MSLDSSKVFFILLSVCFSVVAYHLEAVVCALDDRFVIFFLAKAFWFLFEKFVFINDAATLN